ncbi:MAG: hypothetical protein LBE92_10975 [Chryseobacterium sp.]|jgi:hypothetical protein|uniref:DUF6705 family protein n=1 Tax=Chryseobacterium sp. TaxID=1871047 RepID=UPI002836D791|nr:DUF6705 family protein [Chryseobacterium sp.]MDR2236637.1 hypothetical protein [Chryseobacterium sp.]
MKRLLFSGAVLAVFYCKAQQTYPLNTDYETIPDYAYIKDLNNELGAFAGTYKANYQGNEITLYLTKVENKLEDGTKKRYYMDVIAAKYTVKSSTGIILKDTQNNNTNDFYSIWSEPQENAIAFYYPGTNCMVGWGKVYLYKINSTQLSWDYRPNSMILDQQNCPGNQDTKVYLPVTKDLIFTKQ